MRRAFTPSRMNRLIRIIVAPFRHDGWAAETLELASLAEGVADALRRRGVAEPAASLAAEAGIAAFKVGFQRWVGAAKPSSLAHQIRAVFDELGAIAAVCKRHR